MQSKTKVKFNRHLQHRAYAQFGLLGKSTKEPITDTVSFHDIQFLYIPKSNLGVGTYQRPLQEDRVCNLRNEWIRELGIPLVKMFKHKGRYFYQIVDGQHRAIACPNDKVVCVLSTSDAYPVDDFLLVNNSRNVKSLSSDDFYWAHIERQRHFDSSDVVQAQFVYDTFKKFGYKPERRIMKTNDFGMYTSNIHKFYHSEIVNKLESKKNSEYKKIKKLLGSDMSDVSSTLDTYVELTIKDKHRLEQLSSDFEYISNLDPKDILTDVFNIMVNVFGKETFNDGKQRTCMWQGLMRFLVRDMKFNYDSKKVISALKIGKYSKNGRGKSSYNELRSIRDWNHAVKYDYHHIGFKTEQWQCLFKDTYLKSSNIMNSESYVSSDEEIRILETVAYGEFEEVYA